MFESEGERKSSFNLSTSSELPDLAPISAYYNDTWLAYSKVWLNQGSLAMHFGYWDGDTQDHTQSLVNMNRIMATNIGIRPGQRILDAGCGVGGSAIWLAKTYDVQVVGITPVANQVAYAQRFAQEQGVAHKVLFQQQDYTCTHFVDASFDVIWGLESLCHAPDKRLFLAEAYRLLKPGGRLGINEYTLTPKFHITKDKKLLRSWLSGWVMPNLVTAQELLLWTQEAGFREVQIRDCTRNVKPSLRRLYHLAILTWPLLWPQYKIGLRSEIQQGNLRGALDQYRALNRGLWFYGMLTATVA